MFLQTDLGSAQRLVDASQNTQLAVQYSAWGQQVASSGSATTPLRGNAEWGYYTDVGATAPIWVRARYLEPGRGRWMSQDPIGFLGGMNLYGYTGNRPLEFVDPEGLFIPVVLAALAVFWEIAGPWIIAALTGAALNLGLDALIAAVSHEWNCFWKERRWVKSIAIGALSELGVGALSKAFALIAASRYLARIMHEVPGKRTKCRQARSKMSGLCRTYW